MPAGAGAPSSLHAEIVARSGHSRRLLIALALSLAVLTIEVGGGILTGSLALLSDATHVGVDVIALLVGLGAARLAAREPNDSHTYGYHRLGRSAPWPMRSCSWPRHPPSSSRAWAGCLGHRRAPSTPRPCWRWRASVWWPTARRRSSFTEAAGERRLLESWCSTSVATLSEHSRSSSRRS